MRVVAGFLLASPLSGCGFGWGIVKVPPSPIAADSEIIKGLESKYSGIDFIKGFDDCAETAPPRCVNARNTMAAELMFIIDHHYQAYEGTVMAGRAKGDFVVDSVMLLLTTVATGLPQGRDTKIASGLATLLAGGKANSDKSFYAQQSQYALIGKMLADRKRVLVDIWGSLSKGYSAYPVAAVLGDVERYYRAGTMAAATPPLSKMRAKKCRSTDRSEQIEGADLLRQRAAPEQPVPSRRSHEGVNIMNTSRARKCGAFFVCAVLLSLPILAKEPYYYYLDTSHKIGGGVIEIHFSKVLKSCPKWEDQLQIRSQFSSYIDDRYGYYDYPTENNGKMLITRKGMGEYQTEQEAREDLERRLVNRVGGFNTPLQPVATDFHASCGQDAAVTAKASKTPRAPTPAGGILLMDDKPAPAKPAAKPAGKDTWTTYYYCGIARADGTGNAESAVRGKKFYVSTIKAFTLPKGKTLDASAVAKNFGTDFSSKYGVGNGWPADFCSSGNSAAEAQSLLDGDISRKSKGGYQAVRTGISPRL